MCCLYDVTIIYGLGRLIAIIDVTNSPVGMIILVGLDREVEACADSPCPVDGGYSSWTDWSSCSATCGGSIQLRYRSCNNPVPQYGGLPCFGASEETRLCATEPCNG